MKRIIMLVMVVVMAFASGCNIGFGNDIKIEKLREAAKIHYNKREIVENMYNSLPGLCFPGGATFKDFKYEILTLEKFKEVSSDKRDGFVYHYTKGKVVYRFKLPNRPDLPAYSFVLYTKAMIRENGFGDMDVFPEKEIPVTGIEGSEKSITNIYEKEVNEGESMIK